MDLKVINGNNIDILKTYPDNYFDAVVTDPPYGLGKEPNAEELMKDWIEHGYHEISGSGFMGKEWDAFVPQPIFWKEVYRVLKPGGHILSFFGTRTYDWGVMSMRFAGFEVRDCIQWLYGSGFPKSHNISKALDKQGGESLDWFIEYILEVAKERGISKKELTMLFPSKNGNPTGWLWNKQNNQSITLEQYNIIKEYLKLPFENIEEAKGEVIGKGKAGLTKGDIANFSGETEFDITAPATESAKKWDGWGTALKPANEPIVLARKPLEKGLSIAENILKWGVGGINIDASRIGLSKGDDSRLGGKGSWKTDKAAENVYEGGYEGKDIESSPLGRFPANIILTHHEDCECKGTKKVKSDGHHSGKIPDNGGLYKLGLKPLEDKGNIHAENGQEEIEDWDCHEDCPIRILDEQSLSMGMHSAGNKRQKNVISQYDSSSYHAPIERQMNRFGDKGGASRFFKTFSQDDIHYCYLCGKANKNELWKNNYNNVLNAVSNFKSTSQMKEPIVQENVTESIRKKADQIVKNVANLCDLCVTNFVQEVVEINNLDTKKEQLPLMRDFIQDCRKCTLLQSLVCYVEMMDNIDTTPTTQNLLKLFGYAWTAIENYIKKDIKEAEAQKLGLTRFQYQAKASKAERNKGLDEFEDKPLAFSNQAKAELKRGNLEFNGNGITGEGIVGHGNKINMLKNFHPTVKPIKLMQYLVKMITPPNGIVLDPFCGSGTTGVACKIDGFQFIGLEQDPEYTKIAEARISNYKDDSIKKKEDNTQKDQLALF